MSQFRSNGQSIPYLGYGLFNSEEALTALFGELPVHVVSTLRGFQLVALDKEELPDSLRNSTDLPPNFRIYAVRTRLSGILEGRFMYLDEAQYEAIRDLNFGDELYDEELIDSGPHREFRMATLKKSEYTYTYFEVGEEVNGLAYNPFLNNKAATLAMLRAEGEKRGLREPTLPPAAKR